LRRSARIGARAGSYLVVTTKSVKSNKKVKKGLVYLGVVTRLKKKSRSS